MRRDSGGDSGCKGYGRIICFIEICRGGICRM